MTETARITVDGDATGLYRTLRDAGRQFEQFGRDVTSRFAAVRDQLGKLGNIVAVLGTARLTQFADDAALVAARLKDVTGSAAGAAAAQAQLFAMAQRLQVGYGELAGSFARMLPAVQQMGGGTAEATRLAEILATSAKLSGASSAEAAASAQQFAQALQSGVLQGDELKSILENNGTLARLLADGLGVTVGQLRAMGKEGELTSDRVANALLGRYGEIERRSADLPRTVGGAWVQISNTFQQFLALLEEKFGIFSGLGEVLGALNKVLGAFAATLRASSGSTGEATTRMSAFSTAVNWGAKALAIFIDAGRIVAQTLTVISTMLGTVGAVVYQTFAGRWKAAADVAAEGARQIGAEYDKLARMTRALATGGEGSVLGALAAPAGPGTAAGRPMARLRGTAAPAEDDKDKKKKGPADPSFMQYYEAALAEEKRLAAEQDALREYSKQQEIAYWRTLLTHAQLSAADRLAIQRKLSALELEVRREGAQQQLALDQQASAHKAAMAEGEIEGKRAAARLDYELGVISKQQLVAMELEFHARLYNVQRDAMMRRLELAAKDPTTSPAERQAMLDKLLEMEQGFGAKRNEILGELGNKKQGGDLKNDPLFGGIANSFGQSLEYMLLQARTWQDALKTLWKGVAAVFLRVVVTEPAGQWLAMQAKMLAAKLGFVKAETVAQTAASTKIAAVKNVEATNVVTANAVEAGSGAAGSQAAIPIVGPILAVAAMAAMIATVLALKNRLKSAARGYDIPAGVNPMVQLHEQEMVLPATLAEGVRNLIAQPGGPGAAAGPAGGGGTTVIYAMDSQDVRRFMQRQGHRVAEGLAAQARLGRFEPGFR